MAFKTLFSGLLAVCLFALVSCSGSLYPPKNVLMKIEIGMTPQEVTDLLGAPDDRRLTPHFDEWIYNRILRLQDTEPTTIIVRFADGKLFYLDSFKTPQKPGTSHRHGHNKQY